MNHSQFLLGALADRDARDNPPDLFFNSKNKCEYFMHVVWDNENIVENWNFDFL